MTTDPTNTPDRGNFRSLMHLQGPQFDMIAFRKTQIDGTAVRELFEASAIISDRHNTRVIVDFTGIDFVSSGMMSVILIVHKKLIGSGGKLFVVIPNENVRESFRVAKLDLILRLFPSVQAAQDATGG